MSFSDRIRAKFGPYRTSRGHRGTDYIVRCSFCGRKDRLYLTPAANMYHCFRCGASGQLSALMGGYARGPVKPMEKPKPREIRSPGQLVALSSLPKDHRAIRYLEDRGRDVAEAETWFGVRYCVEGVGMGRQWCCDRNAEVPVFDTTDCLVVPIWMSGALRGWQARMLCNPDAMTEDECRARGFAMTEKGTYSRPPKYFTAPGMAKSEVLFNMSVALGFGVVVVCEGVFDAMAIGPPAVAVLGKAVSEVQVRLLADRWPAIACMLDPGSADADSARLIADIRAIAGSGALVFTVEVKGYKDPGDAPRSKIWDAIADKAKAFGADVETLLKREEV